MISLDPLFAKIPQPERSGTVGVILALLTLSTLVTPSPGGIDPFCGILPWKCKAEASEQVARHSRTFHVQLIGPGRGKGRVCLIEMWVKSNDPVYGSRHMIFPAGVLEDCDDSPGQLEYTGQIFGTGGVVCTYHETYKAYWSDRLVETTEKFPPVIMP